MRRAVLSTVEVSVARLPCVVSQEQTLQVTGQRSPSLITLMTWGCIEPLVVILIKHSVVCKVVKSSASGCPYCLPHTSQQVRAMLPSDNDPRDNIIVILLSLSFFVWSSAVTAAVFGKLHSLTC